MELMSNDVAQSESPDQSGLELAVAAAVAGVVEEATDDDQVRQTYQATSETDALTAVATVASLPGVEDTNAARVARLWVAALAGASPKDLRWAVAALKSGTERVTVKTRYGSLSRGKCWGKRDSRDRSAPAEWADKDGASVYLTEGKWVVGSDDGYGRKDKATWTVRRIGPYLFAC